MSNNKIYQLAILSVIFATGILSVAAIKCHQCNSREDPGCDALDTPNARLVAQKYVDECPMSNQFPGRKPFCRKTVYIINHPEEKNVVRSCGWLPDISIHSHTNKSDNCINADNEGYTERICICHSDGCNSANSFKEFSLLTIILAIISLSLRNLVI